MTKLYSELAKVYYNGNITNYFTYDTSFYLPLLIGIKKERYTIITFCFTLLFPLGWFVWGFSSVNFCKRLLSVFFVLVPSIISSFYNLLFFHHSIDAHLILMSSVIFLLVLVSGLFCDLLIFLLRRNSFVWIQFPSFCSWPIDTIVFILSTLLNFYRSCFCLFDLV